MKIQKLMNVKWDNFKKLFGIMRSLMSPDRYKKPTPNCFYCKQPHWSDEWHNVSTLQERKEKSKGRCYISLHPGHVMAKCKAEKPCYHCKEKEGHHRSLCPRLFKQKKPPSNSISKANSAPPLVEDCGEGQSMFAAGDNANSINGSNGSGSVKIRNYESSYGYWKSKDIYY